MTDSKKNPNARVYTNADLNLDLERAARRKSESKPPTDASSSGATISTKSGNKNALRHYTRGCIRQTSRVARLANLVRPIAPLLARQ